jgi:hypothetical protein
MRIVYYLCGAVLVATLAVASWKGLAGHDYPAKHQGFFVLEHLDPKIKEAINQGRWVELLDNEFAHPHNTFVWASPGTVTSTNFSSAANDKNILKAIAAFKPNDPVVLNNYALSLINDDPIPFNEITSLLLEAQKHAINSSIGTVVRETIVIPIGPPLFCLQHKESRLVFEQALDLQTTFIAGPGVSVFLDENAFHEELSFRSGSTFTDDDNNDIPVHRVVSDAEFTVPSLIEHNIKAIALYKTKLDYFQHLSALRARKENSPRPDTKKENFICDFRHVQTLRPQETANSASRTP